MQLPEQYFHRLILLWYITVTGTTAFSEYLFPFTNDDDNISNTGRITKRKFTNFLNLNISFLCLRNKFLRIRNTWKISEGSVKFEATQTPEQSQHCNITSQIRMVSQCSSDTLVTIYKTTQNHIPNHHGHLYLCKYLKSQNGTFTFPVSWVKTHLFWNPHLFNIHDVLPNSWYFITYAITTTLLNNQNINQWKGLNVTLKKTTDMMVKVKLSLMWSGGTAPCILNLGTWWRSTVSFTPQSLYPKWKKLTPTT
jgi:hypothetical protein